VTAIVTTKGTGELGERSESEDGHSSSDGQSVQGTVTAVAPDQSA
jgi:hypothetical protein